MQPSRSMYSDGHQNVIRLPTWGLLETIASEQTNMVSWLSNWVMCWAMSLSTGHSRAHDTSVRCWWTKAQRILNSHAADRWWISWFPGVTATVHQCPPLARCVEDQPQQQWCLMVFSCDLTLFEFLEWHSTQSLQLRNSRSDGHLRHTVTI